MTPFWYAWPSWRTELVGGATLGLVAAAVTRNVLVAAIASVAISVIYERFIDPRSWSWLDIGQRAVGQALGLAIAWGIRLL